MIVVQIIVFLLGLLITLGTLFSAIRQTVLPGRKKVRLSRAVFRTIFRLFLHRCRHLRTYQCQDCGHEWSETLRCCASEPKRQRGQTEVAC